MAAEGNPPIGGQFRGRYVNRLDAKKRVSVPASFRSVLSGQGLVLRRSSRHNCIEAWPANLFAHDIPAITPNDFTDDDADDSYYVNYADTVDAAPDNEGRLVMDEGLLRFAGIKDSIAFLGKNQIFELWEPQAADAMIEAARQRMQARATARRGAA
jgi:MraZ protein